MTKKNTCLVKYEFPNISIGSQIPLIPKEPRVFFLPKKHSQLSFLLQRVNTFENYYFWTSNHRILHFTSVKMCGINFKIFDRIDCKIFVFKVAKKIFLHIARLDYLTLNLLNLNILQYRVLSSTSLWWKIQLRI